MRVNDPLRWVPIGAVCAAIVLGWIIDQWPEDKPPMVIPAAVEPTKQRITGKGPFAFNGPPKNLGEFHAWMRSPLPQLIDLDAQRPLDDLDGAVEELVAAAFAIGEEIGRASCRERVSSPV